MSFYSALVLAANEGARVPSAEEVQALFGELELLERTRAGDSFGNLARDITALFKDPAAMAVNPSFFCPDSISFHTELEVYGPDVDYTGPGCCVCIHGNGYFYPWR